MNKKTDYVIDSKSSDEQQQFMAIVPKDGITHPKTEEQKPEPSRHYLVSYIRIF